MRGGRPASSDGPAPPQGASQGQIANRRQRVAPPANVGHWSPISRNRSQDAASPSLIYRTSSLYLSAPPPHLGAHELPLSATPKTHPLRPSPHSPSPSSRPPNRRDPFTLSFLCPLNNRASGSYSVHSGPYCTGTGIDTRIYIVYRYRSGTGPGTGAAVPVPV